MANGVIDSGFKNKIATVEFTTNSSGVGHITYPPGFNSNNCILLAVRYYEEGVYKTKNTQVSYWGSAMTTSSGLNANTAHIAILLRFN